MPMRPPIHKPMPWRKPEPKKADPFYKSPAWVKLRGEVLAERGYRCAHPGCQEKACVVDHVIPRKQGGAPLNRHNLQIFCRSHDRRRTIANAAWCLHMPPGLNIISLVFVTTGCPSSCEIAVCL
jgi:hypothetical protein